FIRLWRRLGTFNCSGSHPGSRGSTPMSDRRESMSARRFWRPKSIHGHPSYLGPPQKPNPKRNERADRLDGSGLRPRLLRPERSKLPSKEATTVKLGCVPLSKSKIGNVQLPNHLSPVRRAPAFELVEMRRLPVSSLSRSSGQASH